MTIRFHLSRVSIAVMLGLLMYAAILFIWWLMTCSFNPKSSLVPFLLAIPLLPSELGFILFGPIGGVLFACLTFIGGGWFFVWIALRIGSRGKTNNMLDKK